MTVSNIGSNMTEVVIDGGNKRILVSYETPVAAYVDGKAYKTETKYSAATTRHINKYFDGDEPETKPQSFFDNLLK